MAEVASNAPVGKLKSSTKTFAIVLLVLGLLSLGNAIITPVIAGVAQLALSAAGEQDEELQAAAEQLKMVFHPANIALLSIGFVIGLGMLIGGIATLRRRRWGAQTLKVLSAIMALVTIGQTVFGLYMQVMNKDAAMKQFEDQLNRPGAPQAPEGMEGLGEIMLMVQMFFTVVFGLVFMAVYVWAWLHFSSSSTMAQFDTHETASNRYS
ncbi:MAG: hypothetical protein MUF23_08065 [Pirellula sp.]|jgi:hypothetical protein|nr:hypothetical protein [Pirellula sp.]